MNPITDLIAKYTGKTFTLKRESALVSLRVIILALLVFFVLYAQDHSLNNSEMGSGAIWTLLSLSFFHLMSNLLLTIGTSTISKKRWTAGLFFLDVALISIVLYWTQGFQSDLYLIYFLVIFATVIAKKPSVSFIVAGVACLFYAFLFWESHSFADRLHPTVMLRFPLFFVTAFFTSLIAHSIKTSEELVANISHEIRAPLSSIKLASKILMDEGNHLEWPALIKMISVLDRSSDKAIRTVDDILLSFRMGSGKIMLDKTSIPVEQMVIEIAEEFSPICREKGLILTEETEANLPTVSVDLIKFRQVFLNLLWNAVKFTPAGGTITIGAQLVSQQSGFSAGLSNNRWIRFFVKDSGIGIHQEQQKHIFEKFYQVKGSIETRKGGLGLGLSLVKSIVEAHHGKVSIDSVPGEGSTFFVYVPLTVLDQASERSAYGKQEIKGNNKDNQQSAATHSIEAFKAENEPYVQF